LFLAASAKPTLRPALRYASRQKITKFSGLTWFDSLCCLVQVFISTENLPPLTRKHLLPALRYASRQKITKFIGLTWFDSLILMKTPRLVGAGAERKAKGRWGVGQEH
jgi:hypothetical protein